MASAARWKEVTNTEHSGGRSDEPRAGEGSLEAPSASGLGSRMGGADLVLFVAAVTCSLSESSLSVLSLSPSVDSKKLTAGGGFTGCLQYRV